MRVYVVRAHADVNYEDRDSWTCGVFASEEAAKKYTHEQAEKFAEDFARILELERLAGTRELTDEENKDWREHCDRWYWQRRLPTYYIDEFELQGVEP